MLRLLPCLLLFLLRPAPDADNWPEFRGPTGDGHSVATGLPVTWSDTQNVRWKTAIHGRAWSTPVVWGGQVWMTTATEDGRELFAVCVDRDSGKVLLDRKLFDNPNPEPLGNDVNSYASPSPAIEEGRVFLHFGSPGTACLDTHTFKTLWTRRNLPCRHYRGPSSSPILFEGKLIVTFDGADYQYTAALDTRTGETVWKTDRSADWQDLNSDGKPAAEGDRRKAHSTPLITTVNGQPYMISVGAKAGYAYDPRTGKEIWKVNYGGFSCSMRPVVGYGMAFITTGFSGADFWAVRLDGHGDVTGSNVVWKYSKMIPQKPSPLLVDDLLYLVNDSGVATCLEAKTGQPVWQERIGGHYSASPLYADGRIYCFSEEGKTVVLKPGRKLEILAENKLDDGFMASAAVAGKALFLRTKTHLYRIEKAGDRATSVKPYDSRPKVSLGNALLLAAAEGHLAGVSSLVRQGANVDTRDSYRQTPLILAATGGYTKTMTFLLDHGASINARDRDGNTALMQATDLGVVKAVKLLLDRAANYRIQNQYGFDALDLSERDEQPASDEESEAIRKLLLTQIAKERRQRVKGKQHRR